MINKKMITLGVLAVTGLGVITSTETVFAAGNMTGSGKTTVTYTPGQSPGTDGDGNVSDWTVDYPVSAPLSNNTAKDKNNIHFKLLNTNNKDGNGAVNKDDSNLYKGTSEVTVTVGGSYDVSNGITMAPTKGSGTVKLKLASSGKDIDSTSIATLKADGGSGTGTNTKKSIAAYVSSESGTEKGDQYSAELTWIFTGNESQHGQ